MSKPIQEQFGEAVIAAVTDFAKRDLKGVDALELDEFDHVADPQLRRALAETFYGARWIYKIGLALLVKDEEQMAHVRSQVLDYGAVCEGLLSDCLHHGLNLGLFKGQKFQFTNTSNLSGAIDWSKGSKLSKLTKQSFHWHIEVAEEEQVISAPLAKKLHDMRRERNTIHLRSRTHQAFVGTSRSLYDTAGRVIAGTKAWRRANP